MTTTEEQSPLNNSVSAVMLEARKKLQAVSVIFEKEWKQDVEPHQLDESETFLSEEGLDQVLHLAEILTENYTIRNLMVRVFDFPEDVALRCVEERLKAQLAVAPARRSKTRSG